MADDEYEKFEISQWDLDNEFGGSRQRHKLSKHEQIYGVWADSDNDSDDEPKKGFKQKDKGRKNYTAPISFTSGGVHQAGKKDEQGSSRIQSDKGSSSSEDEKLNIKALMRENRQKKKEDRIAGMGTSRTASRQTGKLGDWEAHTKGIGSKLLMQMGYEPGKGLGKNLQGITAPIVAHKREGRGAIGRYGPEKPTTTIGSSDKPQLRDIQAEDEEAIQIAPKRGQWRKKTKMENEGDVRYSYKTTDDVLKEKKSRRSRMNQELASKLSNVKVIDMTGPEQKILKGYDALHSQHSRPTEDMDGSDRPFSPCKRNFELPELMHNLDLLVDMTEQKIIAAHKRKEYAQDRLVHLKHEKQRLQHIVEGEGKQMTRFKEVLQIVENLEAAGGNTVATSALTLSEVTNIFRLLQNEYYDEYKLFELENLAPIIVFPLVRKELVRWEPLKEPRFCLDIFRTWKDLLETDVGRKMAIAPMGDVVMQDMYFRLVWDVWMPFTRSAVIQWQSRVCDQLIEFMETWMPLLPPSVFANILDQLIMPKIQQEVDQWNPLVDHVPIHSWIHPWLPLLGNRLEIVYPTIRQKLGSALSAWHPSDMSGRRILEPWVRVFEPGAMSAFVIKYILPKLEKLLREYVINPNQQSLDEWNWVISWQELLPMPAMVTLVTECFFPRWLAILGAWLGQGMVDNFDEISQWYSGWKAMFPDKIRSHPVVDSQFKRALDMMNTAATQSTPFNYQAYVAKLAANSSSASSISTKQAPTDDTWYKNTYEGMKSRTSDRSNLSLSFKDLIQRKAEELGVVFMPVPNRSQEAKPVYRFNKHLLYLDRGVIFVSNENNVWVPTSLQSLIEIAT